MENLRQHNKQLPIYGASLVAQMVKHLPTMRETRVWSLGWEDSLEKEMATHSSTLAWKIPWTEDPGRLQSMGLQRVGHDWATWLLFTSYLYLHCRQWFIYTYTPHHAHFWMYGCFIFHNDKVLFFISFF